MKSHRFVSAPGALPDIFALALEEDVGDGDVTARWFVEPARRATARVVAREACVLAGSATARETLRRVDPSVEILFAAADGTRLAPGGCALEARGSAASLLTAERTVLNFLQRLSAVATLTRRFVDAVAGTRAVILDTRKTTPGLRWLEKAAVVAGGGQNHRFGLHDMVMVKDNHLAAGMSAAGLESAIRSARAARPGLRVELEADTPGQAAAFFAIPGVDVVLLDNMTPDQMRWCVCRRPPSLRLEASGGITLENVRAVADTGVDFISIGALTHSAGSVDLSMEMSLV